MTWKKSTLSGGRHRSIPPSIALLPQQCRLDGVRKHIAYILTYYIITDFTVRRQHSCQSGSAGRCMRSRHHGSTAKYLVNQSGRYPHIVIHIPYLFSPKSTYRVIMHGYLHTSNCCGEWGFSGIIPMYTHNSPRL